MTESQGPLTVGRLAARMSALEELCATQAGQLHELRLATSEGRVRRMSQEEAVAEYARQAAGLQRLIGDAVKLLEELMRTGEDLGLDLRGRLNGVV